MPKSGATVQEILAETKKILDSSGGKIRYQDYRDKLDLALPNNEVSLNLIIKRKMIFMLLEGIDDRMQPNLYVVSELPKG